MACPPSRRALFAFARILYPTSAPYRCPSCLRINRQTQNSVRRGVVGKVRCFTATTRQPSDEFLTFQLSNKDGERATDQSPGRAKEIIEDSFAAHEPQSDLKDIEVALQESELEIEDLEDALVEVDSARTGLESNEAYPWYIREEGEITEEEYAEIESFLNSSRKGPSIPEPPPPSEEPEPTSAAVLPWYLREQDTDTSLVPKIDIQQTRLEKYPDIPYNSPPLLQPLISRLFYDHHLQNIIILDLRNRDPPPIWGQNTIMILATARSERQLQSVAESTSKWLKSTAGVFPRIDGLPKRESLVIKRRRLRRKSLRKPGYLITPPRPTTWVSMFTGYQGLVLQLFTEQGREEYDLEGLWGDARVVDAGILDMKPRKVRPGGIEEDIPVETSRPASGGQKKPLWQKKAEKEQKKWDKMKEGKASKRRWTKQEKEQARSRRGQIESGPFWTPAVSKSFGFDVRGGDFQQRRQIHLTASRHEPVVEDTRVLDPIVDPQMPQTFRWKKSDPKASSQKQAAWWGSSNDTLPRLSDTVLPSSVYEQILDTLRSQPPFAPRDTAMDKIARSIAVQGDKTVAQKLANLCASNDPDSLVLLAHFGQLSRFIRNSQLSSDIDTQKANFSMHPYREKGFQWAFDFFLRDMAIRPNAHQWRLAILYYLNLQMFDPQAYPIQRLLDLLLLPVSQGISIPVSTFHLILNHIALTSPEHRNIDQEAEDTQTFRQNVHRRLRTMESVIRCMKSQFGYDYAHDEEIYLSLYKACCQPYPNLADLVDTIALPLPKHHNDHRRLLIRHYFDRNLPMSPELYTLELLQFAHMHKWRSFLKRWSWARSAGIGKDADMWTLFWCLLARSQNEMYIRHALRENYEEMMNEGGHLMLNRNIAIGISKCVELVDPEGKEFKIQRKVSERLLESLV